MNRTALMLSTLLCSFGFGIGEPQPQIIAHRGASVEAPENTMASVRRGLKRGADFIEVDVRITKDGVPIILHDQTVARTTSENSELSLSEMTWRQVQELDAGAWFDGEFAGIRVPHFEELIALDRGDCGLMIELKATPERELALVEAIIHILDRERTPLKEQGIYLGSLSPKILSAIRSQRPDWPLIAIAGTEEELIAHLPLEAEIYALGPQIEGPALIATLNHLGSAVWCWTVDNETKAHALVNQGVSGIITNDPKKMMRAFGREEEGQLEIEDQVSSLNLFTDSFREALFAPPSRESAQ